MNWFPFDMDAWSRRTKEMDHSERGIYVTLLAWYYGTGGPLPLDWKALHRIAETQSNEDRNGLKRVLEIAFDCRSTGWHNLRADEEVTRYLRNAVTADSNAGSVTGISLTASRVTQVKTLKSTARRQAAFRERKAALIGALRQVGAECSEKMTMSELKKLSTGVAEGGVTSNGFVTVEVTTDTRYQREETSRDSGVRANPGVGAEGSEPVESAEKRGISEGFPLGGTLAGEVCRRMKQQGLFGVNPSHPKLLQLLADGATPDELAHTAAEAVAQGKPFAWVLAVVRGRRDDMAREVKQPRQGPKSGRGDVKTNRLQAWVPELVAKPAAPDFAFYDDKVPHVPAE